MKQETYQKKTAFSTLYIQVDMSMYSILNYAIHCQLGSPRLPVTDSACHSRCEPCPTTILSLGLLLYRHAVEVLDTQHETTS